MAPGVRADLCDDVLPRQDLANLDADADQLLLLAKGMVQHGRWGAGSKRFLKESLFLWHLSAIEAHLVMLGIRHHRHFLLLSADVIAIFHSPGPPSAALSVANVSEMWAQCAPGTKNGKKIAGPKVDPSTLGVKMAPPTPPGGNSEYLVKFLNGIGSGERPAAQDGVGSRGARRQIRAGAAQCSESHGALQGHARGKRGPDSFRAFLKGTWRWAPRPVRTAAARSGLSLFDGAPCNAVR